MTDAFDYIVVGAGTAGCVLASRLSEDGQKRVCLVEAGGKDGHPFIHVPAAVGAILQTKSVNWGYMTAPQAQLKNRVLPTPRGKVLGGTSAINGMVYYRGQPEDYDDWAAIGCTGWSYREALPYFIRSENNVDFLDPPYHGRGGPLTVSSIRKVNPLNEIYAQAALSLGIPRCEDFNAGATEGVGLRQGTIRSGGRVTSATAFLRPARKRPNLQVLTDALVHRILIIGGRAAGVELEQDGEIRRVAASGEVILAAGAYGTPQLLMLSGIGHPAQLKDAGLPIERELPAVGENLHDHVAVQIKVRTKDTRPYGVSWKTVPRGAWNVVEYAVLREGPLASHVFESHIVTRSRPEEDRPDLQMPFWTMLPNANGYPIPFGHGYAISVVNNRPESRGSVRLKSRDPRQAPIIDPNIFSVAEDMEPIVRGVSIARQIFAAEPFRAFEGVELAPGPNVQSDDEIRAWMRDATATTFHPCGTCRMGGDADSVVDPALKVRGVEGLRVADASVFPRIMRGNTQAAVIMVAEKAADMILGKVALPPADVEASAAPRALGAPPKLRLVASGEGAG
jgi:choline dehydrogenase-like flavoprotein